MVAFTLNQNFLFILTEYMNFFYLQACVTCVKKCVEIWLEIMLFCTFYVLSLERKSSELIYKLLVVLVKQFKRKLKRKNKTGDNGHERNSIKRVFTSGEWNWWKGKVKVKCTVQPRYKTIEAGTNRKCTLAEYRRITTSTLMDF